MTKLSREKLFTLVQRGKKILEIGPYLTPCFRGSKVRYLDVLSVEEMIERTKHDPAYSYRKENMPERIHYVITKPEDYKNIEERFDTVFSAHNIEHQYDFIGHLQNIAQIMISKGKYYLCIPDKRFCFDHFKQVSCFTEMIDVHERNLPYPTLGKFLYSAVLSTHNDPVRHWADDSPAPFVTIDRIRTLIDLWKTKQSKDEYIDNHNWYFTPETFIVNCKVLNALGYIPFIPLFVSETTINSNEFYACLLHIGNTVEKNEYSQFLISADAFA